MKAACPRDSSGQVSYMETNSPLTLTNTDHQWTVSTNTSYNQWISLAEPAQVVTHVGRNRSLVTRTSKCEWAITQRICRLVIPPSLDPIILVEFGKTTEEAPIVWCERWSKFFWVALCKDWLLDHESRGVKFQTPQNSSRKRSRAALEFSRWTSILERNLGVWEVSDRLVGGEPNDHRAASNRGHN